MQIKTSSAWFDGILIVSVVIRATPIVAVSPGSAPMITPTSDDARISAIDNGSRNDASAWPKRISPSNIVMG